MDSYLASNDYRNADNFFFNLNFEVLKGCQFQCTGCHVNKEEAKTVNWEDKRNLLNLLNSIEEDPAYKCFIAFIGPTDFLVADNTVSTLTDPFFKEVFSHFKRLSFQTTCLNIKKSEEIAEVLKRDYPNHELEINVLIEPEKVTNEKYINTLISNRDKLFETINWPTKIRTFAIMNLYDYQNVKKKEIADILKDYQYMHSFTKDLFETTIDFNFSFGRKGNALNKLEFLQATEQIKALFNKGVNRHTVDFIRFSFGKLLDSLIEFQYNWLNGKLYSSPLLYERYVSFIDPLEIDLKEWTIEELEDYETAMSAKQFADAFEMNECSECQYLKMCVDRQIINLMSAYDIKDCLVAKGALEEINGQPNPYKDVEPKKHFIPISATQTQRDSSESLCYVT